MSFIKRIFGKQDVSAEPRSEDAIVVETMLAAGADLSQPTQVRHYFYLAERKHADEIAGRLKEDGFSTTVRPSAEDYGTWLVLAEDETIVSERAMNQLRESFEELAGSFEGGDYDGWEAAVE